MLTTRRLFQAVLWCALFALAVRNITDGDFWWHLRTGEYILQTREIPHQDIFSYTRAGQEWIAHEWLSETFIAAIYELSGFGALIVVFASITATSFFLAFRRSRGNLYVSVFVTLIGAFSTFVLWDVRPQMLALLLASLLLWLLDRYRQNEATRALWFLLPVMLLWVNLHGSFLLAPVLVGIYLVGGLIEHYRSGLVSPLSTRGLGRLAIILILMLLIIPLNPNGARMYTYALETLNDPIMQTQIVEWQSPDFHSPAVLPFAALILATLAGLALSPRRLSVTQAVLLVITLFEGLRAVRFIPLFALVVIPVLSEMIPLASRAAVSRMKYVQMLNWSVLGILVLGTMMYAVVVVQKQPQVEQSVYPVKAIEFVQRENLTAPMFNLYEWGGYLIWKLYPERQVFVDGRADVYGALVQEYLDAYRAAPNVQAILERYRVGMILIPPRAPLVTLLSMDPNWRNVFQDGQAVIFLRR